MTIDTMKTALYYDIKKTINSNADIDTKIEDVIQLINTFHEKLALELKDEI